MNHDVLRINEADLDEIHELLQRYDMQFKLVTPGEEIPGSYWGDEEAGLRDHCLLARPDTPVHSVLHEASHYICMDPKRRQALDTDAGGDYDEENAVCYLQILLADELGDMGRNRMFRDMDQWGYSFRLGSAARWFEDDAEDARHWLESHALINPSEKPTWKIRE